MPDIDFNPQFLRALELMENSRRHAFITGRAGTGKSTLLDYFRHHTGKRAVFLAPTGVAAVNIQGQTIHSFFGFKPDITPSAIKKLRDKEKVKLFQKLETIVIDEVSMVRADLLDCVDTHLRLHGPQEGHSFGGVQMIFIGDLYQLPPVVTSRDRELFKTYYRSPYFFSARSLENLDMEFIELEKIYRQTDDVFIGILNAIRNRSVTDEELALLNERCIPDFAASSREFFIHMTSTNDLADRINDEHLKKLRGKIWTSQGIVEGDFGREHLPTSPELKLKKGAQIMLLNNDTYGRWINGTIGRVKGFSENEDGEDVILATLDNGLLAEIGGAVTLHQPGRSCAEAARPETPHSHGLGSSKVSHPLPIRPGGTRASPRRKGAPHT
ncbi:MAG: AAA family ATPase [Deltaproteobacteria bacterium]|nr:AAA family ATPase [Deltaproteobacteria bacterium]